MTTLVPITRDGQHAQDATSTAWLAAQDDSLVLTVRQPCGTIPRSESGGDPHPDDAAYDWPGIGRMA